MDNFRIMQPMQRPAHWPDDYETRTEPLGRTDAEWRTLLTPEQYEVLRGEGTECAFSNAFFKEKRRGTYRCAGCGLALFASDSKFDSGTGWPSFFTPMAKESVAAKEDRKLFVPRTEVRCARCGGHLGHVFPDGPPPTGLRYCINSAALHFESL